MKEDEGEISANLADADDADAIIPADQAEAKLKAIRDDLHELFKKHDMHSFVAAFAMRSPGTYHGQGIMRGCLDCSIKGVSSLEANIAKAYEQTMHLRKRNRPRRH